MNVHEDANQIVKDTTAFDERSATSQDLDFSIDKVMEEIHQELDLFTKIDARPRVMNKNKVPSMTVNKQDVLGNPQDHNGTMLDEFPDHEDILRDGSALSQRNNGIAVVDADAPEWYSARWVVGTLLIVVVVFAVTAVAVSMSSEYKIPFNATNSSPNRQVNTCSGEFFAYSVCSAVSEDTNNCLECAELVLASASLDTCQTLVGEFCSGLVSCRCGNCAADAVAYIACMNRSQCEFDCRQANIGDNICATRSAVVTCLDTEISSVQAESCTACMLEAMALASASVESCTLFGSDFCRSLSSCDDCMTCAGEIVDFVDCAMEGSCMLDCAGDPCSPQKTAYLSCFDDQFTSHDDLTECVSCVQGLLNGVSSVLSCSDFDDYFCEGLENCDCDACAGEIEDFVHCIVDDAVDCQLHCGSQGSDSCEAQQVSYQTCLSSTPDVSSSCRECIELASRFASSDSCVLFENTFCPTFRECSCGDCLNSAFEYVSCLVGSYCELDCTQLIFPNERVCAEDSGGENDDGFQICLDMNVSKADRNVFSDAIGRWSKSIVGDVRAQSTEWLDVRFACTYYPDTIDDLYICAKYIKIDGESGILGQASVVYVRTSYPMLPFVGVIDIDIDDVVALKITGELDGIVLHEIAHTLGLGSMWNDRKLSRSDEGGCKYVGENANREWQRISGCNDSVPLEQQGGEGTECYHWSEDCLMEEIMTGYAGNALPILSNITIAGLEDLGYQVNYTQAERYTVDSLNQTCVCTRRLLSDDDPLIQAKETRGLSWKGLKEAEAYGKRHLNNVRKTKKSAPVRTRDNVKFVGDENVVVFYKEEGKIYRVYVTSSRNSTK